MVVCLLKLKLLIHWSGNDYFSNKPSSNSPSIIVLQHYITITKFITTCFFQVGDIPDADIKPPDNVLFVCKLNPVTQDQDLEIIFSRFGPIKRCVLIVHIKLKQFCTCYQNVVHQIFSWVYSSVSWGYKHLVQLWCLALSQESCIHY